MMMAAGATPVEFNPLTGIPWHTASWAGDPLWSNPGDGNEVATWRGVGRDFTNSTATEKPLYRSSSATMNNKPAVDFDGNNDKLYTPIFTAVTVPHSWVIIARWKATGLKDMLAWAGAGIMVGCTVANLHTFRLGGTQRNGSAADTNKHMFHGKCISGAADIYAVDNTDIISGVDAGNSSPTRLFIADSSTTTVRPGNQLVSFVGFYAGDVTAHANWGAFKTWAANEYALTLA